MTAVRILLAVALPLSALLGLVAVVPLMVVAPEPLMTPLRLAIVPLGVALGAGLTTRMAARTGSYSFWRRFWAGVLGVWAAVGTCGILEYLGVPSDALWMACFYGGSWMVAFIVLGKASPRDRADHDGGQRTT